MAKKDLQRAKAHHQPQSEPAELMTRAQVAKTLAVSISTVRRMEGRELQPLINERGVHLFDADQVVALAKALARTSERPRGRPGDKLSPGDLAAECFERFAQRQSLHEIVTALRVTPGKVRKLHREWLLGLQRGALGRGIPSERDYVESFSPKRLEKLLAELPIQPTRISVAIGIPYDQLPIRAEIYDELGGFVTHGPIKIAEITERFGQGTFRISAYSLTERRMLWEVRASP